MVSNNMSDVSPLGSMFESSVMDFNKGLNVLHSWYSIATPPTCYSGAINEVLSAI